MYPFTRLSLPSLAEEYFFDGLDPAIAAGLDAYAWHRQYDPRQIIYFPDDRCDYVYWVRSGRVKITHVTEKGKELTFRHLFKGDFFGEECLLALPRRDDYAEAMTGTVLTLVRCDDFLRAVQTEASLSLAVAQHCCRRALAIEETLSDQVFVEVRQRIARRLIKLYRLEVERKEKSRICLTHQELANLIGASRETVTASLRLMQNEGLIALGNRCIRLLDLDGLQQTAHPL
jgi:CRP/FNR family cyclic AMP-dependent transcriptional regulator